MSGIVCDRYSMGRKAAEMMLARIDSRKPQPSAVFRGKLIPGATVAPPSPKAASAVGASVKSKRKSRAV
jgi:hypothetical protein